MDILIICQEAGFRRNINLSILERELGITTATFRDLLRHLTTASPTLQLLNRTNELVFHYVNQDGRLVPVRAGDSLRTYASQQTFFLLSSHERVLTTVESYSNAPRPHSIQLYSPTQPIHPRRSPSRFQGNKFYLLTIAILVLILIGVVFSRLPAQQQPVATPTVVDSSTPTQPPVTNPLPILYKADWSNGLNGWNGASDWSVANGMLVDNGSGPHFWRLSITAPFNPKTPNYAIESQIQVVSVGGCSSFGLVARAVDGSGEQMGVNFCECNCAGLWDRDDVPHYDFNPGTNWHTYRLEIINTSIKFLIDGVTVVSADDNRFITPGSVGLWCDTMAINVRSFIVYAL